MTGQEAVRARLTMTVHRADAAEFERAWHRVAEVAHRAPGNRGQSLCRMAADPRADPEDPVTYVITSDWVDVDAFRRFERSDEQDAAVAHLRALRRSVRMELLDLVATRDADG